MTIVFSTSFHYTLVHQSTMTGQKMQMIRNSQNETQVKVIGICRLVLFGHQLNCSFSGLVCICDVYGSSSTHSGNASKKYIPRTKTMMMRSWIPKCMLPEIAEGQTSMHTKAAQTRLRRFFRSCSRSSWCCILIHPWILGLGRYRTTYRGKHLCIPYQLHLFGHCSKECGDGDHEIPPTPQLWA